MGEKGPLTKRGRISVEIGENKQPERATFYGR
jgi:hypothetical protein